MSDGAIHSGAVGENSPTEKLSAAEMLRRAQMSSPVRNHPNDESNIDPRIRNLRSLGELQDSDGDDDDDGGVDEFDNGFTPPGLSTPFSQLSFEAAGEAMRERLLHDANMTASRMQLLNDSAQELRRFALSPEPEKLICLYGGLLSIKEKQMKIASSWKPSESTNKIIRKCAVRYLIGWDVKAYKALSEKGVESLLDAIVDNGLPMGWKINPAHSATVSSIILKELTQARSDVKKAIQTSMGQDNGVTLDIKILADKLRKMAGERGESTAVHWSRYALLRTMGLDGVIKSNNFYDLVDKELEKIRKTASRKFGTDQIMMSAHVHKTFVKLLNMDMEMYGYPAGIGGPMDANALALATPQAQSAPFQTPAGPSRKRARNSNH